MMLEEMELDGADAAPGRARADAADARAAFPVVVIGCGQSGLLAGIRLQEAGIPFTIIEKNPDVGGTWFENSYPGCRVDVGNHFYCYSFEPSDQWTEFFARQPEIQSYFPDVMHRHGIDDAHPLEHRGRRRRWDDDDGVLGGRDPSADGTEETLHRPRRHLRGRPAQPPEPPRHPRASRRSRARRSTPRAGTTRVDYRGKRVAVIGAGASGFQIAPTIAPDVAAAHRVPAHRAVDVPQPELPRAGRARRAVGAAPPAVLRALVPLLVVLAGLRRRPRRPRVDPDWPRPAARGQRHQRHHPRAVHRTGSPNRSATTRSCSPR